MIDTTHNPDVPSNGITEVESIKPVSTMPTIDHASLIKDIMGALVKEV